MKKILFWGHPGNVDKPLEEQHHLSPVRSQGHAQAFVEKGYDVTLAAFYPEGAAELGPTFRRKHLFDLDADDYDIVFLNYRRSYVELYNYANNLERRHFRLLRGKEHIFQKILDHPNITIQLDAPRPLTQTSKEAEEALVKHIKHIAIGNRPGAARWRRFWNVGNDFLCLAATINYRPPVLQDPMPNNGRPRALYLGRLNDAATISSMDKLEELAKRLPGVDFIVVSCKVKDRESGRLITPMLTEPDSITQNKIVAAKKQFNAPNIIYMPGPRYSDTFQYMYHADVGLGFAVRKGQDVCSCKTYEYLGSGCPIVIEEDVPEVHLLDEIECGKGARTHDFDDMASKIEEVIAAKYNRKHIQEHFLQNHTYQQRIGQFHERYEAQ